MDITFKKIKKARRLLVRPEFAHNLYFYKTPPTETIQLQAFQDYALDRLKILKAVEKVGRQFVKGSMEYTEAMRNELNTATREGSLKNFFRKSDQQNTLSLREVDNISHFVLRLAFCKSLELRKWLLDQETDLFHHRFVQLTRSQTEDFFRLNDLSYKLVSKEEKESHKEELISTSYHLDADNFKDCTFYKVHFTEVVTLVRSHQVFLSKGWAFVQQCDIVHSVAKVFRSQLSKDLAVMSRNICQLSSDPRIHAFLHNLASSDPSGSQYQSNSERKVTAEMVDELSRQNFPLCMSQLHEELQQKHHLKHFGRLQLGLFLKAVGLSLDDSLQYWKKEFTKSMDADKFYKHYAYNIRYNYGKEGKKIAGKPYSCSKIISNNNNGAGDCHGCPFKRYDTNNLRLKLKSLHISADHVNEISDLAKGGHHQLACGRLFEVRHPKYAGNKYMTIHPNQYFDDSVKINAGGTIFEDRDAPTETLETTAGKVETAGKEEEEEMDVDDKDLAMIDSYL